MTDTKERTHRNSCPALQAWDIPGACNCDRPVLRNRCQCGKFVKGDNLGCAECNRICNEQSMAGWAC